MADHPRAAAAGSGLDLETTQAESKHSSPKPNSGHESNLVTVSPVNKPHGCSNIDLSSLAVAKPKSPGDDNSASSSETSSSTSISDLSDNLDDDDGTTTMMLKHAIYEIQKSMARGEEEWDEVKKFSLTFYTRLAKQRYFDVDEDAITEECFIVEEGKGVIKEESRMPLATPALTNWTKAKDDNDNDTAADDNRMTSISSPIQGNGFETVPTSTSFSALDFLTPRAHFGSQTLLRIDANHRNVHTPYLTNDALSSRPGMITTLKYGAIDASSDDHRTFTDGNMGFILFGEREIETTADGNVPVNSILENSVPLVSMGRVTIPSNDENPARMNLKLQMKNRVAVRPTAQDVNTALSFFGVKTRVTGVPTTKDLAGFMQCLSGLHLKSTRDVQSFLASNEIPLFIPDFMPVALARLMTVLCFQMHSNLRATAYEGGHRQALVSSYMNGYIPSPHIPCDTVFSLDFQKVFPKPDSCVFSDVAIEVSGPIDKHVLDLNVLKALRAKGRKMTAAAANTIQPSFRSTCIDCVNAYYEEHAMQGIHMLEETDYVTANVENVKKDAFVLLRHSMTKVLFSIFYNSPVLQPDIAMYKAAITKGKPKDPPFDEDYFCGVFADTFADSYKPYESPKSGGRHHVIPHLLKPFSLVVYTLLTMESLVVLKNFFGEPMYPGSEKDPVDTHSKEFLRLIVDVANDATSVIIDTIKQHDHYKQIQSRSTSRNKVTVLVRYNVLCDILKAVTRYGPNPMLRQDSGPAQLVE